MKNSTLLFDHVARGLQSAAGDHSQVQRLMDELTWELRALRRQVGSPGTELEFAL